MSEQSQFLSRALVSAAIQSADLLPRLVAEVNTDDLDAPYCHVLTALVEMRTEGQAFDPLALHLRTARLSHGLPGDLIAMLSIEGNPAAFDYHLHEFKVGLARRRLADVGAAIGQAARAEDLRMGFQRVREMVDDAEGMLSRQEIPLVDGDVLWDYEPPPDAVLLPGLLWRQGRVVITGHEGAGKSIMLRMLVIAGALGLHPFQPIGHIDPIRTLYLDLENPPALAQERMRVMLDTLRQRRLVPQHNPTFEQRFKFLIRSQGIDIVGKGADRQFLTDAIDTHRPDLLCIGPIYRMAHAGGDLDEATVGGIIDYLNHLRVTYDLAVVTEAHPPHGSSDTNDPNQRRVLRPSGSSAWMRFPEVGRGLRYQQNLSDQFQRKVFKLEDWRGDRHPKMKFPRYVARAVGGQVWFDDFDDLVDAS